MKTNYEELRDEKMQDPEFRIKYLFAKEKLDIELMLDSIKESVNLKKCFGNDEQKEKFLVPLASGEKIGAFGSLLMAMIISEFCIPVRCCTAPEMPTAMYTLGLTV
jgi:hypothetical protein